MPDSFCIFRKGLPSIDIEIPEMIRLVAKNWLTWRTLVDLYRVAV